MIENDIKVRQNSPEGQGYLCAYSSVYAKAKLLLGIQFTLTIPVALGWSVVLISYPDVKPYMILYSFSVTLLDVLVLDRLQSQLKEKAARIQEIFDCFLFEMPWRKLQVGEEVDLESLNEEESRYRSWHKRLEHLHNWFHSDLGAIPLIYARLICQRINLLWDTKLRKRYVTALKSLLAVFALLVILFSVKQQLSMHLFFGTVVAVLSPAFIWGIREITRHQESINKLRSLKSYVDAIWRGVADKKTPPEELQNKTIEIQTEIYRLRSKNPVIFNWVYKLQRSKTQRRVHDVTRDLITELRKNQVIH
jgi:hypothetical protein